MPYRTVKQARLLLQGFTSGPCCGQKPKAINTEKLINYIAELNGWDLEVKVVSMTSLRGTLLRKMASKDALMLISDTNTNCWKRFTAVKEAAHLFIELEDDISCDNALVMAEALILQTSFMPDLLPLNNGDGERERVPELQGNAHALAESSAIVAAIELMIPEHHRPLISKMAETDTLYKIANEFKVPKVILEYRLNAWGITPRVSTTSV